jgi:2-methylisocitrate lyase-like PEP mutase family enzyme
MNSRISNSEPKKISKASALRELIYAPGILLMPGVFDCYSTRLVQASGFTAGFISGGGLSESRLGWSDFGLLGYEENLNASRNMVACTELPLLADADTGYGNAVNVHFTVRGFETAGVAGIMLEDQSWPKRCGHMSGKQVISSEEAAEKIKAAANARQDPDFVIKARTDALATHGLAEVIRRLNLYAEAGADLLFADALLDVADISTVVNSVTKPVCVNMGFGIRPRSTTPLLSARQLEDLGVAVVIYPRLLTAAALQGMTNAVDALKESLKLTQATIRPDLLFSFEQINALTGFDALRELEKKYVPGV